MHLGAEVARRIVERVAAGLDKRIGVADAVGRILASTDARLVGKPHPLAARAIASGELSMADVGQPDGVALPLVYGDAVVGAIVVNDGSPPGQEIARVAKTLAELIIHQSAVIDRLPRQKWVRDQFVYDLLHERFHGSPEEMEREAELLAIDLNVPRIVAVVHIGQIVDQRLQIAPSPDSLPSIARRIRLEQVHAEVLDQLRQTIAADRDDVYSFIDDRRLVVLAVVDPLDVQARRGQLTEDLQRFLDVVGRASALASSAGVGWYHPGWQALAQSCVEAQFALETGSALYGPGRAFQAEDLGLAGFICGDSPPMKVGLAERLIDSLAQEPDLLATLDTFFDANLSPSATAQRLHIHRHTLAYRLDKIAHLTGRDPRQFGAAAQLYAALLLRKAAHPLGQTAKKSS